MFFLGRNPAVFNKKRLFTKKVKKMKKSVDIPVKL